MPDLLQVLVNLSGAFPALISLAIVLFALVGLFYFGIALLDIYSLGQGISTAPSTGRRISAGGVATKIFVSVVLTSLIYFMDATQNTLIASDASSGAMMYKAAGMSAAQKAAISAIFGAFMLAGVIAFGRGWMLLDKHFNGGNVGVGGSILHILGGTMLVYMDVWLPTLGRWTGFDFANILIF